MGGKLVKVATTAYEPELLSAVGHQVGVNLYTGGAQSCQTFNMNS